jgi:GH15 family glucan-1,4-alpha-glucosidase
VTSIKPPALRLEDYALVGDCQTAALVGRDGAIDWLCWPRFHSPACFAALLGTREHGRWLIRPAHMATNGLRHYRPGSLILETTWDAEDGTVTVIDFMSLGEPSTETASTLVRLVRGDRGNVDMRMELVLRFDYGRSIPWVTRLEDGTLRAVAGPNMAVLRTPASTRGDGLRTVADFTLHAGETVAFVLTNNHHSLPP